MSDSGQPAHDLSLPRNLVLIGYRGSGKSSVGRTLASRLGWDFVDTDERIEAETGRTIREIFAADGQAAFRELEAAAVSAVASGSRQVIGVGGGAVLRESNRVRLRKAGWCVWLKAPANELHRRMQDDPRNADTRPPLTGLDELTEIRRLLRQREPLYAALADHVVDTAGRSVGQVVEDVLALLG